MGWEVSHLYWHRGIDSNGADKVEVSVVKVNLKSPLQFKLLCKFSTIWPAEFAPFEDETFQTII